MINFFVMSDILIALGPVAFFAIGMAVIAFIGDHLNGVDD